ncbi:hypothetical protein tloyanaT_15770 [Thalassotalea loyana]|uniref:Uncharacterized protein n=1 Tax=Thalassotalea loyana TaxID=280483 RepID=A0ABQ6HCW9_9GAMM|nr:hypothetical protein [Thalassotalea loyana]GLX85325.1 hypothetical protein tloyanaT_15770 [Thalassotalea loyana]
MKSLSSFCFLLWLVPYFGKQHFPDIFSVWYIQWTSFALLSILLPFGFVKSILRESERKFAPTFLFIFLINIFLTGVGLNLLSTTNQLLSVQSEVIPENISLEAINNEDPEVRSVIAQAIYKEFGQPIMFKDSAGKLVVYSPSIEDKEDYSQRFLTATKAKEIIKNTERQMSEIVYLFAWACSSFLIIFALIFRVEQSKANKRIK